MKPLSKATAGDDYTINWLMGIPEVIKYLQNSNICEGSVLHVINKYADAILISCDNKRYILGDEVARRIQVTPC